MNEQRLRRHAIAYLATRATTVVENGLGVHSSILVADLNVQN
jgi:hypothetical protein